MSAPAGAVNAYRCKDCDGVIVTEHADAGTTPMFLACRLCDTGEMVSFGYPRGPIPRTLAAKPRYVWYRPSKREMKRLDPVLRDHVERGGLLLRDPNPEATDA